MTGEKTEQHLEHLLEQLRLAGGELETATGRNQDKGWVLLFFSLSSAGDHFHKAQISRKKVLKETT